MGLAPIVLIGASPILGAVRVTRHRFGFPLYCLPQKKKESGDKSPHSKV
jgi:hypothetical protein